MGQIHNTTAAHDRPNVGRSNGRLRDRIIARGATRHEPTDQPTRVTKIDYFVMAALPLPQIRRPSPEIDPSVAALSLEEQGTGSAITYEWIASAWLDTVHLQKQNSPDSSPKFLSLVVACLVSVGEGELLL